MALIRLLITRLNQLFGNILKLFFLLHFYFYPKARFVIPKYSPAIIGTRKSRKIPRVVWQTNYTREVAFAVYFNYHWNRVWSPTHEYYFLLDEDVNQFVRDFFTGPVADAYFKLQIGAARADMWRILTLLQKGGVYMDIDSALVYPLEWSIHESDESLFVRERSEQVTNYFIASTPHHPVLEKTIDRIRENIDENTIRSVFDMTGPTPLGQAVEGLEAPTRPLTTICRQGVFVKKQFQYPKAEKLHWLDEQKIKAIVQTKDNGN